MSDTPLYIPSLQQRGKFKDYRMGVWGNSFTWHLSRSWDTIKHIVIHHSVTTPTNDAKSDVDYIAELHRRRGWDGVGYHFIITADGMVWYVGDIGMGRANVANKNHLVIGVCLVGDFTKGNPTDEQILSAHDLTKFFIEEMPQLVNVSDWESGLKGHKELQATQCPGTNWKGVSDSIYERIKNRIPYAPVPVPAPEIDWEKAYSELKIEKDDEIKKISGLLNTAITNKNTAEGLLAQKQSECQQEIADLTEKMKDAQKENPNIKTIVDFTFGEFIDAIVERVKTKLSK